MKFNRKLERQERILVITNLGIYNIKKTFIGEYVIRRFISHDEVAGVVFSNKGFELNFLVPESDRGDLRVF